MKLSDIWHFLSDNEYIIYFRCNVTFFCVFQRALLSIQACPARFMRPLRRIRRSRRHHTEQVVPPGSSSGINRVAMLTMLDSASAHYGTPQLSSRNVNIPVLIPITRRKIKNTKKGF